ncbi:MAG TPA: alginate lyase family protein [Pyrinomonadaceae bacterium]|nr:alginate lyase family protein [Pyrinomonadaceae bacterium]
MQLSRLKKISFDELRVRGTQKWSSFSERRGWSTLSRLPSDAEMLSLFQPKLGSASEARARIRKQIKEKFFEAFADRDATLKEFRQTWPNAEAEIVERANRIVNGRFDLLGFKDLSFGDPIDWHLEPIAQKRSPLLHWSQVNYLESTLVGDKKIIWELNRQQYFIVLGQAYWLTGDERYARTFIAHIESWIAANPPKLGINWASSLEVSFRTISWLWALAFFVNSPTLSDSFVIKLLKFLYLSGLHIENYLSTYFAPNTHLSGEALGLYYLGTLLRDLDAAERWRRTGRDVLLSCLSVQLRADGVYFEQSSYYHRYTTDFYLHFRILSQRNNETLPPDDKLQQLLDHLLYITRPDGTSPLFGDDDGGRLVMLEHRRPNDFRAVLSTGAVLFNRGDYKYVAGNTAEETLWLLGPGGVKSFGELPDHEPEETSFAFRDSGYYVMRDGWQSNANYLLFDCGPHGALINAHSHADCLSFELAVEGRLLLQDPGTFTYTGSSEWRDLFRGSASHNALTIDGEPQSEPDGPFTWRSVASCTTDSWLRHRRFDFVSGRHDGYQRLADPVIHVRSILFLKHDYWVVRDQILASGKHAADLWFHFTPDAQPQIDSSGFIAERGVEIATFAAGGAWKAEAGWVSECYGQRGPAPVCVYTAQTDGSTEIVTFMLPRSSSRVRETEAKGGRAFEVSHGDSTDVIMIRGGEEVETARFSSNFEWTWLRYSGADDTKPDEAVLLNGRYVLAEGEVVFGYDDPQEYVSTDYTD